MRRVACALKVGLGVALMPVTARAHLVETGFGAFYNGLAHVVLTPSDLLLVVGLALLAGQRGAGVARRVLLILPLAWLAGGALAAIGPWAGVSPSVSTLFTSLLTTLSFGLAGALIAFDLPLRPALIGVLAALLGLLHGVVNGATMVPGIAGALALAGAATAVFCLLSILSAEVSRLSAGWARTGVRVAGSWIAAAGVLSAGWLFR